MRGIERDGYNVCGSGTENGGARGESRRGKEPKAKRQRKIDMDGGCEIRVKT